MVSENQWGISSLKNRKLYLFVSPHMIKDNKMLASIPEVSKRMKSAFPVSLSKNVEEVDSIIPVHPLTFSRDDIGLIKISGASLYIPHRFYSSEPDISAYLDLSPVNQVIFSCLYTRHHNGFIRMKYVKTLLGQEDIWVSPFVLQLLGEYVVEIIEIISQGSKFSSLKLYHDFILENAPYIRLLKQRMVSYWNQYYRYKYPCFRDYPGFKVSESLGIWNSNEIKHILSK